MLLITLAYLGGLLTILSPCILPVLPFVFARGGRPFLRNGLPLLAGMALTFAVVASLAAVGGAWVVRLNQYGRWLALAFITLFALTLLLPSLAERLTRPVVAAGNRLSEAAGHGQQPRAGTSLLIGIATGLLWAPCAGPILGLVLTGAALQGASIGSSLLLLAYAAGAATSLALALLAGGRLFEAMKRSLGAGEWLRRGLGAVMLAGVAAIALGLDTGLLSRLSTATTASLEQRLVDRLSGAMSGSGNDGAMMMSANTGADPAGSMMRAAAPGAAALPVEGTLPALDGAVQWLNSPPLTAEALKGKVVLVDFWTYSCINCLRSLPYVKAWADKYRDQGLVVIGVHAPEFAFERDIDNVKKAARDLGVTYPVAIDNDYAIWKGFNNQYWPAHYFIDAQGRIRYHHFGEGRYQESERVIQQLLREAGQPGIDTGLDMGMVSVNASGAQQAATQGMRSPETYVGYERAEHFASPGGLQPDRAATYRLPGSLGLNEWGLDGEWQAGAESTVLNAARGHIAYRFKARDLHLVLGPSADGQPVRFKVTIDGQAPGQAHGTDVNADGSGMVSEQRLYQLLRVPGEAAEHTFSIEFLDPGVHAYAFTFG